MNNVTAIVLGGGVGTRLRPLTYFKPKPLIKVKGKPSIQYVIDNLNKYGISQLFVNIHHKPIQMMNYLSGKSAFLYEPTLLGTAGTVKSFLPYQSQEFFVVNADTITTIDLEKMMQWHKKGKRMATLAWDNGKCTGTMIFNKSVEKYLPDVGMIDDALKTIPFNKYNSIENKFWDIGTWSGLMKARKEVI